MDREELKSTLGQLHEQLQSGEPIDPEVALLLRRIADDVNLLSTSTSESAETAPQKESLLDQLMGFTRDFEESHPELAETIGRVASALSRIGI
jgi:hypothetical protein